jgi:ABC-type polysaccharide/polyol phosphate transport system ATPase subunit
VSSLSASDTAVQVEGLHITYRAQYEKVPTMKSALLKMGRRERAYREVQALRGVSFDVPRAQVMGIVGANGAGKSTLMRVVAGILPPTAGRVRVHGRVSTLLALGVGFNNNLSGRDNVLLGGLAAGLTRDEVAERYDEITEFAELGDFMDLPMKTYSAGMYGRLGFAVAVHMRPDILLIDEALSAGDARFKEKCTEKMKDLCSEDRTILIVSHGLATVKEMCTEAVWLHQGQLLQRGRPDDVVDAYVHFLRVGETPSVLEDV